MADKSLLSVIEEDAKHYAEKAQALADAAAELEAELAAVRRRHLTRIKRLAASTSLARRTLANAVEANRALFKKPRTRLFHGIRVGLTKGKGKISWADGERVVELIKRHLPDQAKTLIKATETPVKAALAQLAVADLKRIGVTVGDSDDQVVIKGADTEVDKLVAALLEDASTGSAQAPGAEEES